MPKFKCCICGKYFSGFGNNPWPINQEPDALCCDDCDNNVVVPKRIELIYNKENNYEQSN